MDDQMSGDSPDSTPGEREGRADPPAHAARGVRGPRGLLRPSVLAKVASVAASLAVLAVLAALIAHGPHYDRVGLPQPNLALDTQPVYTPQVAGAASPSHSTATPHASKHPGSASKTAKVSANPSNKSKPPKKRPRIRIPFIGLALTATPRPTQTASQPRVSATPTPAPSSQSATPAPRLFTTPSEPQQVAATASDGQAVVNWIAPSADGGRMITGYAVTSDPGGLTATTPDGSTLSATVAGLTNGVAYTFTVTATNSIGTSGPSAPSVAVTPAAPPSPPTGVSAQPGDGEVTLLWAAPTNDGGSAITGYTVHVSDGSVVATADDVTTVVVPNLSNGTPYTFTVTATNSIGTSGPSAQATATPVSPTPTPPQPSDSLLPPLPSLPLPSLPGLLPLA